ncbi:MAG TPA: FCD domain-containing protein [Chloroflexota bacterium]
MIRRNTMDRGPEAVDEALPRAPGSLVDELAARVRARIVEQNLAAGDRLGTKSELARRYGVSAGTVNAALRLLGAQGIAESRPGVGGGVFVSRARGQLRLASILLELRKGTDEVQVSSVFQARLHLELLLARLAAQVRTDDDVQTLRDGLALLWAARENPSIYTRRDWDLHDRIAQAARDPVLLAIYRTLMDTLTAEVVDIAPTRTPETETSLRLHERLVQAIVDQDPDAATSVAEEHAIRLRPRLSH